MVATAVVTAIIIIIVVVPCFHKVTCSSSDSVHSFFRFHLFLRVHCSGTVATAQKEPAHGTFHLPGTKEKDNKQIRVPRNSCQKAEPRVHVCVCVRVCG